MSDNQRYKKGSKDIDLDRIISQQPPGWKIVDESATRDAKNRRDPNAVEAGPTIEQLRAKFTPNDTVEDKIAGEAGGCVPVKPKKVKATKVADIKNSKARILHG